MQHKYYWLGIAGLLALILWLFVMCLWFNEYTFSAVCMLVGAFLTSWNERALRRHKQGVADYDAYEQKRAAHAAQIQRIEKAIQDADRRRA